MSSTPPDFSKNPDFIDHKLLVKMEDYFMAIQKHHFSKGKTMWIKIMWLGEKVAVVQRAFIETACRGPGSWLCDLGITHFPMNVDNFLEYRYPSDTIWELDFQLDDDDRCYEIKPHRSWFKDIPFFAYDPKDY